jgi:hypothetical protein
MFVAKKGGMKVAISDTKRGGRNMKKTLGSALIACAFLFGIIVTSGTTADAQWSSRNRNNAYVQQELNRGYQQGINTGAEDAQRGRSYSAERSRHYDRASSVPFREGFVRGYDQGYRQYAGAYGNDSYRNRGRNDGYYRRNDGYGGYNNQQLNAGYQQGLHTGASDGQENKSYSPERSKHYKNASTQAFREGFVRGYDQGYRQYAGNGNYRRSNSNSAASIFQQILGIP